MKDEDSDPMLARLKGLTIKNDTMMTSQYQNNYQPMAVGVRHRLWREGYECRNQRKMNGFKHSKLEWRQVNTGSK